MKRRAVLASAALCGIGIDSQLARAQGRYPARPIKLLVSSPPGSTFDAIARSAGTEAEKKLGQPIVLEHPSGAGGTPAFVAAKNAAADGYTLVVLSLSTIRQPIQQDVGYEGVKDFIPGLLIASVGSSVGPWGLLRHVVTDGASRLM